MRVGVGERRPGRGGDPRWLSLPSQLASPPQISRSEWACPSWQNSGLDGDRSVRHALRLGEVPAHQGGGQAPSAAGYLPSVVVITEGKRHDVRVARTLRFDRRHGSRLRRLRLVRAADGARQEVFFVTRLKDNAVYEVVERRPSPERTHVRRDEIIRLTGVDAATKCPHPLRRVEVYDAEQDDMLVFLTNHLTFGATTIAAIYKARWQIELFFKALKQNLKIKTFRAPAPMRSRSRSGPP